MTKRPVSAIGNRRAISEYARVAAALGGNPRYKVMLMSFRYFFICPYLRHRSFEAQLLLLPGRIFACPIPFQKLRKYNLEP